ncbi:protein SPEC3-like [Mytilus edulis]|uniref:protein SPEC3-like n=1 Tax=Mytilus edulis TaxID=6550 RepID=UPI0039EFAB10
MPGDFADRIVTPAMPLCMAYFCCVLNFIIPGSGTVVAGVSVFCCAENDDMEFGDKCTSCCCGLVLGLFQLLFTAFLLVGWCWSAIWGYSYIEMSKKHYTRRTHRRRRIQPITSQPVRRRLNQRHWTQPDTQELCIAIVSQPNHLSCGSPPPPYYEEYRGLPTDSSRTAPPSYQSLFPNRPLG